MSNLPEISSLPSLDAEERAQVLDLLFEPCVQLHTLAVSSLREEKFASYDELADSVGTQLTALHKSNLESDTKWLEAILMAHPRLGAKKVDSEQSRKEQAQLNQAGSVPGEAEKLAELNARYEKTFPGLIYVVFVNGRSRPVIMEDMEQRIARGDIDLEKREAIKAMCDIAKDRAKKINNQ